MVKILFYQEVSASITNLFFKIIKQKHLFLIYETFYTTLHCTHIIYLYINTMKPFGTHEGH